MRPLTEPSEHAARLLEIMVGPEQLRPALHEILTLACQTVDACEGGSLSVFEDGPGSLLDAAHTDDWVHELDEIQFSLGLGPCYDATKDAEMRHLASTGDDGAWPDYSREAARRGVGSVLALPLVPDSEPVGALNLYARSAHAFSERDIDIARRIAAPAGVVLHNFRAYERMRRLADQLEEALSSRAVIEQAKGIIMARQGCDADAAFQILQGASQQRNEKLRDIAAALVAGVSPTQ